MAINVPLLRKTMEHIEAHPEEWDQRHWAIQKEECGTAFCFAGTAIQLSGEKRWQWDWHPICNEATLHDTVQDCQVSIAETARKLLGLRAHQASDLFEANNTLPELRRQVTRLIAEEETTGLQ